MENLNISLGNMDIDNSNVDIVDPNNPIQVQTEGQATNTTEEGQQAEQEGEGNSNEGQTPDAAAEPASNTDVVESFLSGTQDTLEAETIEERNKLFNIFGVVGYDANRNLLDKDGKVVLMYSHLEKYLTNGELPVNQEGKLVYADGSIVEGVQYSSFVDEANSVIRDEFGFEISNINEINQIPDEAERKATLVKSIVHDARIAGIENFLQSNPAINEFYTHLRLGGTPDTFKGSGIDYSKIEVEKLGDSDKLSIIKDLYKLKNLPISDSYLKFVQTDANALNEATTEALKELATNKQAIDKENQIKLKQQQEEEARRVTEYWNEMKTLVNKGTISDTLTIPEKDKEGFFRYLSAPVKNGLSQDMIDEDSITQEERLMLSYIRYKGKSIKEFINTRTDSAVTARRRDALRSFKPIITSNGTSSSSDVSYKGISLDNIRTSNQ